MSYRDPIDNPVYQNRNTEKKRNETETQYYETMDGSNNTVANKLVLLMIYYPGII